MVTNSAHRVLVRILAHRGSPSARTAENTVGSITAALHAGADGVEVDLRLSSDGVLVVCHDPDLTRLVGVPLVIARTPYEQLRCTAAERGVALARVEQVLAASSGAHVVLELKQPPNPGRLQRTAEAVSASLAGTSSGTSRTGPAQVTISSFSAPLVAAARQALSGPTPVRTALLGRPLTPPSAVLRQALRDGHDEVHPHIDALLAEPGAVAAAHRVGITVVPWTVNGGWAARRLAQLGIDGVITDVPVALRAALAIGVAA